MKTFNTTIGHLYDLEQSIIRAEIVNMSFSRKGSFSIARNLKKISNELETYKDERSKLIKQYAGETAESINPDNPHWAEFYKEFLEMSNVEVSLEINTIVEDDFPTECTPMTYVNLEFMTEENEDNNIKEE